MADGRFDDLLLALASKHKNVEDLSYSVLSFFERRTDLFHVMETPEDRMGFHPGVAEKMMLKQFSFFQHRYIARAQPYLLHQPAGASSDSAGGEASTTGTADVRSIGDAGDTGGSGSEGTLEPPASTAIPQATAATTVPAPMADSSTMATSSTDVGEENKALPEKTRRMMQHISTWNGAVTDKYYWSQSIAEVTVEIEVEECRSRDIQVDIKPTRLVVKCKGNIVLEGKIHEKINVEESLWHLDDNKIVLSLEKQRQTWWKCVLEGDKEIDTTKVESTRRMDEYDGETQGAIRKIMFDQNQKAMGKPSSDQLRTAEVMREAWNAPGSPFRGTDFDPTMLNLSGPVPDDFFEGVEKRRLEEACARRDAEAQGDASGS